MSEIIVLYEGGEDEIKIPAKYEVCPNCEGKGSHVNRAIDGHGLSREDFDEDPDFREDYMSGVYDVPCDQCKGTRVVLEPDEGLATSEQMKAYQEYWDSIRETNAIYEAERRMGA